MSGTQKILPLEPHMFVAFRCISEFRVQARAGFALQDFQGYLAHKNTPTPLALPKDLTQDPGRTPTVGS